MARRELFVNVPFCVGLDAVGLDLPILDLDIQRRVSMIWHIQDI